MDFLWELFQQRRITTANDKADDAKHAARSAESLASRFDSQIRQLEQQNDRLTLAVMALAEILRDQFQVSQDTIEAKMRDIDIRDGKLDGKMTRFGKLCRGCGRVNGAKRTACLYCGESLPQDSFLFPGS